MSTPTDSPRSSVDEDGEYYYEEYEDKYEGEWEDPYFAGLDEAARDRVEYALIAGTNHEDAELMIFDLERGIYVTIAFADGHATVQLLHNLIAQHPEFACLIQPILDYNPESAGAGYIDFRRSGDKVEYTLTLTPFFSPNKCRKEIKGELTFDLFRQFVTLTESFGCFTTDDGNRPLNF